MNTWPKAGVFAINYGGVVLVLDKIKKLINELKDANIALQKECARLSCCRGTTENPHDHYDTIAVMGKLIEINQEDIADLHILYNEIQKLVANAQQADVGLEDLIRRTLDSENYENWLLSKGNATTAEELVKEENFVSNGSLEEILKVHSDPLVADHTFSLPLSSNVPVARFVGYARDNTNHVARGIWIANGDNIDSFIDEYNTNDDLKNDLLIIDYTNSVEINYQVYNSYMYSDYTLMMDTVNAIIKYNNDLGRSQWKRTAKGLYCEWVEHNWLYLVPNSDIKASAKHADLDQYANGTIFGPDLFNTYE